MNELYLIIYFVFVSFKDVGCDYTRNFLKRLNENEHEQITTQYYLDKQWTNDYKVVSA